MIVVHYVFLHENRQDMMMYIPAASHICKSANKGTHIMTATGVLEDDWRD